MPTFLDKFIDDVPTVEPTTLVDYAAATPTEDTNALDSLINSEPTPIPASNKDFITILRDIRGRTNDLIAAASDPDCIYGELMTMYGEFQATYLDVESWSAFAEQSALAAGASAASVSGMVTETGEAGTEVIWEPLTKVLTVPRGDTGLTGEDLSEVKLIMENSKIGWRLRGAIAENHSSIGTGALDLTYSPAASALYGASGAHAFATGTEVEASGDNSFAAGEGTIASAAHAFVLGKYNSPVSVASPEIMVVGVGADSTNRMNALEIYKNGMVVAPQSPSAHEFSAKSLVTVDYAEQMTIDGGSFDQLGQKVLVRQGTEAERALLSNTQIATGEILTTSTNHEIFLGDGITDGGVEVGYLNKRLGGTVTGNSTFSGGLTVSGENSGVIVERENYTNASILWNETTSKWEISSPLDNTDAEDLQRILDAKDLATINETYDYGTITGNFGSTSAKSLQDSVQLLGQNGVSVDAGTDTDVVTITGPNPEFFKHDALDYTDSVLYHVPSNVNTVDEHKVLTALALTGEFVWSAPAPIHDTTITTASGNDILAFDNSFSLNQNTVKTLTVTHSEEDGFAHVPPTALVPAGWVFTTATASAVLTGAWAAPKGVDLGIDTLSDTVATNVTITSSTLTDKDGTSVVIPSATSEIAGVMSASDKEYLDQLIDDSPGGTSALGSTYSAAKIDGLITAGATYVGPWDASTNIPDLESPQVSPAHISGDFYKVVVSGVQTKPTGVSTSYAIGDTIQYDGVVWSHYASTDSVTLVNGQSGQVLLGIAELNDTVISNGIVGDAGDVLLSNGTTWEDKSLVEAGIQVQDKALDDIAALIGVVGLLSTDGVGNVTVDNTEYSITVGTVESINPGNGLVETTAITSTGSITVKPHTGISVTEDGVAIADNAIGDTALNVIPTVVQGKVLTSTIGDGFTWETPTIGTVTGTSSSLTAIEATDISFETTLSNTTPALTLNIPNADVNSRGALTAADWDTFNKKSNVENFTNLADTPNDYSTITLNTNNGLLAVNSTADGIVYVDGIDGGSY